MKAKPLRRLIDLDAPGRRPPPVPDPAPLWLSQSEAAARLHTSLATLKARIADGTIYAIPVGESGKHYRVPVGEIEKFRSAHHGSPRPHPAVSE